MSEQNGKSPADLESFQDRLNTVRQKHSHDTDPQDDGSLLGMAWRLSTEIVVAVLVGAALGYGLDTLLGTKPWIMLIGLGFGFATGLRNVMRVAEKMDAQDTQGSTGGKTEAKAQSDAEN